MAEITSVSGQSDQSSAPVSTAAGHDLDRNAFLNLLITQMQHQDPMQPLEDRDFLAQLAQFSSLEQMQQMNQKMNGISQNGLSQLAAAYLGTVVTAQGPDDATPTTGTVTAVTLQNGQPMLSLGSTLIDPTWVTRIEVTAAHN